MHRRPFIVLALLLVLGAAGSAGAEGPAADRLHALFDEQAAWYVTAFPEQAAARGDGHADRLTDRSPAAVARRGKELAGFRTRLAEIGTKGLGPEDRLSAEVFDFMLGIELGAYEHRRYQVPIGPLGGLHLDIPQMVERGRFASARDFADYLERLKQVRPQMEHTIAAMREGMAEGRTPPRSVVAGVAAQLDALIEPGALDLLRAPLEHLPSSMTDAQIETMRRRFEIEAFPAVRDALTLLWAFWNDEYFPACRTSVAATALPDGAAWYAHRLRVMTSTDLGAEELHELGLAEVERIRAAMIPVIRQTDFLEKFPEHADAENTVLVQAFIDHLLYDERFYFDDGDELLTAYRDICKRVDAKLPKYFELLPRLPYGVRAVPDFMAAQQVTAYSRPGSMANGEPGILFVNRSALRQRPKYEMIPLALHEAVPGHHLQRALIDERDDLPAFRRTLDVNAFSAGWALYAEGLGLEMGMYEDPYDAFGRLHSEMRHACALVIDPAIHALGWTRDEATAFLRMHTASSDLSIRNDVDRIIAFPGEACGDTIGALRLHELRRRAEMRLGRGFDLRVFHRRLLEAGPLPLDVLERRMAQWTRRIPGGAIYD